MNKEVYIIGGPNGTGKTTFAKEFKKEFKIPFINADEIAFKLTSGDIKNISIKAGKIFLNKIENCINEKKSFILESTLSGKYLIKIIDKLNKMKYKIKLIYIFVENESIAIERIQIRVQNGGHTIPDNDVMRRFSRSKNNFWNIYRHLVNEWEMFYNSGYNFIQVAIGENKDYIVLNEDAFKIFKERSMRL